MSYLFLIFLGFLPSLIWLSFYLRKDIHPEPKSMILKVFIWGMLLAPLAIILELLLIWLLDPASHPLDVLSKTFQDGFIRIILAATLIPALVEEYLKYSVIKYKVIKNSAFDEPTDAMIYLIVAGLGFAAIENLLVLFKLSLPSLGETLSTIGFRFLGATLVHALGSGIIGYWLARSLLYSKHRKKLIFLGLTLAIIFHSCYNYFIITALTQPEAGQKLFYLSLVIILIISTALLISFYFKKLKKQQAVCQT